MKLSFATAAIAVLVVSCSHAVWAQDLQQEVQELLQEQGIGRQGGIRGSRREDVFGKDHHHQGHPGDDNDPQLEKPHPEDWNAGVLPWEHVGLGEEESGNSLDAPGVDDSQAYMDMLWLEEGAPSTPVRLSEWNPDPNLSWEDHQKAANRFLELLHGPCDYHESGYFSRMLNENGTFRPPDAHEIQDLVHMEVMHEKDVNGTADPVQAVIKVAEKILLKSGNFSSMDHRDTSWLDKQLEVAMVCIHLASL